MKLYADTHVRRTAQIIGDLALVIWVWVWIEIADKLRDAGRSVAKVPLVGDSVRSPFDGAGRAASGISDAGRQQVAAVGSLAHWLGLAVALIPILVLLWFYLPQRLAFIRRATAGQRFLDSGADLDLFALRAMSHQPLHVLAKLDADPAGAWRRGDRTTIERLAVLELRSVGLRPPADLASRPVAGGVTPG